MYLSVIIPTLNRSYDIKNTIESILRGSILPQEIIIIDQSDNDDIKNFVLSKNLSLIKYHHQTHKSLAKARNFGLTLLDASTEVVFFLDDDVVVDHHCFDEVVQYLISHPDVQGGLLNIDTPTRDVDSFLKKLGFFLLTGNRRFDQQFISKGGFNAMFLEQPTCSKLVERCSGCGMFFRKNIFYDGILFPQNFEKYSLMEDVFFSYTVHKRYPDSLHYIVDAKIIHHESPIRSISPRAKIMQNIIHRFLFVKEFDLSYIGYIWTIILLGVLDLITYKKISVLSRYIEGVLYVVKNRNILSLDGNLLDYNIFIFQK